MIYKTIYRLIGIYEMISIWVFHSKSLFKITIRGSMMIIRRIIRLNVKRDVTVQCSYMVFVSRYDSIFDKTHSIMLITICILTSIVDAELDGFTRRAWYASVMKIPEITIQKIMDAVVDKLFKIRLRQDVIHDVSQQTGRFSLSISHHFPKQTLQ